MKAILIKKTKHIAIKFFNILRIKLYNFLKLIFVKEFLITICVIGTIIVCFNKMKEGHGL